MELINIKDLITELKNQNINLGKGNPYNRLRYYTKIGWIDHMVRKKDEKGTVVGHYPISVIDKLIRIENLKSEGKSNEEITELLKNKSSIKSSNQIKFNEYFQLIKSKFNINLLILLIIVFGFFYELNNYNSLNEKIKLNKTINDSNVTINQISESGRNVLRAGQNKIFINSKKVNLKSLVFISFENNLQPATYYFISEKIIEEGFTIETNLPVNKDANFTWIIIN